ncbi:uncharacterized protein LOC122385813 [Amphibalanus amphitrite]|uniref:uncharacterized protein LOC122385813 n=1 Tax=Amphibalanus amphitrite TaxID=1232801 RepID=UPI001C925AAC|nr:uncharacterized protein LOC122385813 [Amphibalanus amphitrite]
MPADTVIQAHGHCPAAVRALHRGKATQAAAAGDRPVAPSVYKRRARLSEHQTRSLLRADSNKMLRHVLLVCLVAAAAAKEAAVKEEVAAVVEEEVADLAAEGSVKEKRQVGYGAPSGPAPSTGYGGGFVPSAPSGYSAPSGPGGLAPSFGAALGGGFGGGAVGGGSGGKCRDETKYILTWTKAVIPVTVYDTRTEYLPTTLYKYVTETEYYPHTVVQLETTTRGGGAEYQEETKIAYRTNTVVIPQVDTITSTLVFTEDEHVTVTETDHFTQTQAQQYPVEVTVTSVQQIPQVQTSVATEYQTQYQTQYVTNQYEVVQTQTANVPQVQYITNTVTQQQYQTVAVTKTQKRYQTVTKCAQQGYPEPPRRY